MIERLGIFDSGLGGYSVYHDLMMTGPDISYVLYADQKNAPYGNKSKEEIIALAIEAMSWFETQGIEHVLLACNTVSSVALKALQEAYPEMTIWGIIDLTLSQLQNQETNHITVVSTQATHNSGAYLQQWGQGNLSSKPLDLLVSLIEGNAPMIEIDDYLHKTLKDVSGSSHLILACTHYPLVLPSFINNFPGEILDSRLPIRQFVQAHARPHIKVGEIYTSGETKVMKEQIKRLFDIDEEVRKA